MNRLVVMLVGALLLVGCSATKDMHNSSPSPEKMALGWLQRSDILKPDYPMFIENYDTVHVDENFVQMIKTLHNGIDVLVLLGTWCGDSKREVPRFLKIADLTSLPPSQVKFYGVDRAKKGPDGVADKYHLERVPTFIFFKNGAEVGRIVESAKTTLEADMLVILAEAQNK